MALHRHHPRCGESHGVDLKDSFYPRILARIPLSTHTNTGASAGTDTESWVWTFLRAALATGVGYDEAREVVKFVQISMGM